MANEDTTGKVIQLFPRGNPQKTRAAEKPVVEKDAWLEFGPFEPQLLAEGPMMQQPSMVQEKSHLGWWLRYWKFFT